MAIFSLSRPADIPAQEVQPGTRLRRARERLGLTYRDVERASYELACRRGRPEFILHLSRLADIENRDVTPSLYKLYTVAVIYHLDPKEVCQWYKVPLEGHFSDGAHISAPNTHLAAGPAGHRTPVRFDPAFDPTRTEFLTRMIERWGDLEGALFDEPLRYLYGYVGLEDRRMYPLLRPGSLVLIDPKLQEVRNEGWGNEYERPIYFIELRQEYRCCWCLLDGSRLMLIPHPLSSYPPEEYRLGENSEVLGQVVGSAMRFGAF